MEISLFLPVVIPYIMRFQYYRAAYPNFVAYF